MASDQCAERGRRLQRQLCFGSDYASGAAAVARGAAEQRREQRDRLEIAEAPRDLPPHIASGARRRRGEDGAAATSAGSATAVAHVHVGCAVGARAVACQN